MGSVNFEFQTFTAVYASSTNSYLQVLSTILSYVLRHIHLARLRVVAAHWQAVVEDTVLARRDWPRGADLRPKKPRLSCRMPGIRMHCGAEAMAECLATAISRPWSPLWDFPRALSCLTACWFFGDSESDLVGEPSPHVREFQAEAKQTYGCTASLDTDVLPGQRQVALPRLEPSPGSGTTGRGPRGAYQRNWAQPCGLLSLLSQARNLQSRIRVEVADLSFFHGGRGWAAPWLAPAHGLTRQTRQLLCRNRLVLGEELHDPTPGHGQPLPDRSDLALHWWLRLFE